MPVNSSQTRKKWKWTRYRKSPVTSSPCDEFTGYRDNAYVWVFCKWPWVSRFISLRTVVTRGRRIGGMSHRAACGWSHVHVDSGPVALCGPVALYLLQWPPAPTPSGASGSLTVAPSARLSSYSFRPGEWRCLCWWQYTAKLNKYNTVCSMFIQYLHTHFQL